MFRSHKGVLPLLPQVMATFFDCFCGAGGLTCGLRAAGLQHLGGCDSDRYACDSYEANHGAVLRGDMRHLTAAMVLADKRPRPGPAGRQPALPERLQRRGVGKGAPR